MKLIQFITSAAQSKEAVDSPSSAASNRIQSYMKNKLLSLGKSKTQRNLGNRLDFFFKSTVKHLCEFSLFSSNKKLMRRNCFGEKVI